MTDLLTTPEERQEFRLSVRRFLAERSSAEDLHRLGEDDRGYDPDVWKQLASDLGLAGLLVPEQFGGQGLSLVELCVALEEVGRTLLAGPVLSTAVLAPLAVLATGDQEAAARLLPRIADGSLLLAVALPGDGTPVVATATGSGWTLEGVVPGVLDAAVATRLLVVAQTEDGLGVFEVDPEEPGTTLSTRATLDRTVRVSRVTLAGAAGVRLGGDVTASIGSVRDAGALAASAQLLGIGDSALEIAVAYAAAREQFGKPIGAYQGVKHLCADMHARQSCSRAAVDTAARTSLTDPELFPERASVAKAWCSPAGVKVVEDCIQVLGGIGFTWEHPAHLYLRRAKVLELLFGDARTHRARLAVHLGLQPA